MTTLGERLRIARDRIGLYQVQVSEKTNINNKTLSGYENDVSQPDTATLSLLAEFYGVSYRWLLTGEGPMVEKTDYLSEKDEKDIAKRMEHIKNDLIKEGGLSFYGEPLSEEAKESLLEAMEYAVRTAQKINKKYIPKKYRKDND